MGTVRATGLVKTFGAVVKVNTQVVPNGGKIHLRPGSHEFFDFVKVYANRGRQPAKLKRQKRRVRQTNHGSRREL